MSHSRLERVAEELKREIGKIIQDELNDPRVGFVTITKVELTRDLRNAKVHFSLYGTEKQLRDTKIGLKRSAGFIRSLVGKRIRLRYTPEISFVVDEGAKHSIKISQVLQSIKDEKKEDEHESGN
jgi:ribosome-binding factor A